MRNPSITPVCTHPEDVVFPLTLETGACSELLERMKRVCINNDTEMAAIYDKDGAVVMLAPKEILEYFVLQRL